MANVRETIFDNLDTQLQTITTGNGYITDQYGDVLRDRVHPSKLPTRNVVWQIGESTPDVVVRYAAGNVVVLRMEVMIHAYVPGTELASEVPMDRLNEAIADIRELIAKIALGVNVSCAALSDLVDTSITSRYATFAQTLVVIYFYDADTP